MPKKAKKSDIINNRVRDSKGRLVSNDGTTSIDRHSLPGALGFFHWVNDHQPQILKSSGEYSPIKFEKWQIEVIQDILEVDENGKRKHSFCLLCWPKRHSKSVIHAILVLWAFTTRPNWLCVCLANNYNQTLSVNFRLLQDIILNTPSLKRLIVEKNVLSSEIRFPKNNNRIVAMANNISGAHGLKLSCLWCTELWTSPDLKAFRALFASLADTENSVCYLDTNTDFHGGVIQEFEEEAKKDPSMFAHRIEYSDYEQMDALAPSWITRSAVRVSSKIDLDQDFSRNWLNKRSASKSQLFQESYIQAAKSPYKAPADLQSIVQGRKNLVTGGVDKAKNLLPGISNSDYTVWVCLLKVADPASTDPHHYYILNMVRFDINTDRNIKKAILEDHKRYGLSNVCLEFYEVSSISGFLSENHIEHELVSATDSYQNASFPEMHRIFRDRRFHFPENLKHFEDELRTFSITQKKGGTYSFGHSSQKFHDDTVHATNLAIWAGRKTVLNVFELPTIQCLNKSPRKSYCYIMGGNFVLPGCSINCLSHEQVETMYQTFIALQTETELSIVDFFRAHVKTSVRISQAA